MAEFLTLEVVLQHFDRLRADIIEVAREGQGLAKSLTAVGNLQQEFEIALAKISHAKLSLVVIGAEGVGKSTLISGLLGRKLSLTSENEAGAVAPVYITHGLSKEPTFEVWFLNGKAPRSCSFQEYKEYIQQSTNPNNEREVLRATVRVSHELLEHGLQLVEMPGTGGGIRMRRAAGAGVYWYSDRRRHRCGVRASIWVTH